MNNIRKIQAAIASADILPRTPAAPELLTPMQLAFRLGVSRRTLSNWTHDRLLPMIKIGRVCRYDYAKVRAVLERHEQPASGSSSHDTAATSTTLA